MRRYRSNCSIFIPFLMVAWSILSCQSDQVVVEKPYPEADSLLQIAQREMWARNTNVAADYASQALELSRQRSYRAGEIKAMRLLGFGLEQEAFYDSAITLLTQARALAKKYHVPFGERGFVAHHLASNYLWQGKYDNAIAYYNEALKYFSAVDTLFGIAAVYNGLGIVYAQQGYYPKAQEIWEKGLTYAKRIAHNRYYERSMIGNLGNLYRLTGNLDRAIPMIETSLRMGRDMQDRRAQAIDLGNLGDMNLIRGNFRVSIQQYTEAARLREQIEDNRGVILTCTALGKLYDTLNEFNNAEIYYAKGIDIVEKKLGGNFHPYPGLYKDFGIHWIRRGDYAKAEALIRKAIKACQAINSRNDWGLADLALAELQFRQGKYTESINTTYAALRLAQETQSTYQSNAYLELGLANYALDKKDSALQHFKLAIDLSRHRNESEIVWAAHDYLARYFKEAGDLPLAAEHSRQALAAIEQLRRYTISPEIGSSFLADKVEVYQQYADILFAEYQQQPQETTLENMFAVSEQSRSRALLDNLKRGAQNVFSQSKQSAALQNLEHQIVAVNRLLRDEQIKPKAQQHPGLLKSWNAQAATLHDQYALLSSQFAAASPQLSAMLGVLPQASIKDLQKILNRETAILSYYTSVDALYAFVITLTTANVRKLVITPAELWNSVSRLRKPFQDFKQGKVDFLRLTFDAELSHQMYTQLVAPLLPALQGASTVIIVPSGPLCYLPFELLVTGHRPRTNDSTLFAQYEQYRFLIEAMTITYLPSSMMVPILARMEASKAEQALLALGNPISNNAIPEAPFLAMHTPPPGLRTLAMTPLPGAALEVNGIARAFGNKGVSAFTEHEASEAVYKNQAAGFRYIHFATHGYIDEHNPNFSALLLNPGSEHEDGLLYAYEIYAQPLQAEMVSLSACETGLGKFQQGEGLISFVQAFFTAGSRSVMASLWSVEESTYPLMVSFYKNIYAGMRKAEALRQAKLGFMRGRSKWNQQIAYSHIHPFLWAPFVSYGVP